MAEIGDYFSKSVNTHAPAPAPTCIGVGNNLAQPRLLLENKVLTNGNFMARSEYLATTDNYLSSNKPIDKARCLDSDQPSQKATFEFAL